MPSTTIQYFNAKGVLRSVVIPRALNAKEIERFQEYFQNDESGAQNLLKSMMRESMTHESVKHPRIVGGPYDGLSYAEAEFLEQLGWRAMWAEEEKSARYLRASDNSLTQEEIEFLREHGLDVPASAFEEGTGHPSPASSLDVTESEPQTSSTRPRHGLTCLCENPWSCIHNISPFPISTKTFSSAPTLVGTEQVRRPRQAGLPEFLVQILMRAQMQGRVRE